MFGDRDWCMTHWAEVIIFDGESNAINLRAYEYVTSALFQGETIEPAGRAIHYGYPTEISTRLRASLAM
jgi:hypothetical protein